MWRVSPVLIVEQFASIRMSGRLAEKLRTVIKLSNKRWSLSLM